MKTITLMLALAAFGGWLNSAYEIHRIKQDQIFILAQQVEQGKRINVVLDNLTESVRLENQSNAHNDKRWVEQYDYNLHVGNAVAGLCAQKLSDGK